MKKAVEAGREAFLAGRIPSKAYEEGFYADLVVPCQGLAADNNVRGDTSLEKLGKLRYSVFRLCATYDQFMKYGQSPPGVVVRRSSGARDACDW